MDAHHDDGPRGIDAILPRLAGVKKRGKAKWVAQCPAHGDKTPSLSILESDNGNVVLHCFGGCSVHAVLDAVGLEIWQLFREGLERDYEPARPRGAHAHAAGDLLGMMAEASVFVMAAAECVEEGKPLNEYARARLQSSVDMLRGAVRMATNWPVP